MTCVIVWCTFLFSLLIYLKSWITGRQDCGFTQFWYHGFTQILCLQKQILLLQKTFYYTCSCSNKIHGGAPFNVLSGANNEYIWILTSSLIWVRLSRKYTILFSYFYRRCVFSNLSVSTLLASIDWYENKIVAKFF